MVDYMLLRTARCASFSDEGGVFLGSRENVRIAAFHFCAVLINITFPTYTDSQSQSKRRDARGAIN